MQQDGGFQEQDAGSQGDSGSATGWEADDSSDGCACRAGIGRKDTGYPALVLGLVAVPVRPRRWALSSSARRGRGEGKLVHGSADLLVPEEKRATTVYKSSY